MVIRCALVGLNMSHDEGRSEGHEHVELVIRRAGEPVIVEVTGATRMQMPAMRINIGGEGMLTEVCN
jgi:hypothetical protein